MDPDKSAGLQVSGAGGLLGSAVDLCQLKLKPSDIVHIPNDPRYLYPVSHSYSALSYQHEITESGNDDTLKRNCNARRQKPKESCRRCQVGYKRKYRDNYDGKPKDNSLEH